MDRHSYLRKYWFGIPKARAETLKQPRHPTVYVTTITLVPHSPPTRQPRKDYTTKTPVAVVQQEVIKEARR